MISYYIVFNLNRGRFMKNFFLLIVFIALFNQSFAQDSCKTKDMDLKHGIQFQVTNIFNLTNFNGYTFSYRYLINNNSGLRVGLLTNFSNQDEDITQKVDTLTNNPPTYSKFYNFKISVQYLHSILRYNDFDLIIGGGPFVSLYNSEGYDEYLGSSYLRKYTSKIKTTGFGIDIIAGVEYRLTTNIVFSAEYGLTFSKESSELVNELSEESGTTIRNSSQNGTVDRTFIRGTNVSLGITIFF